MLDEGIEIPVAVEQVQAILDTAGGDHGVYRLAHGDAQRAQGTEVFGRLEGDIPSADIDDDQGFEQLARTVEITVGAKTLQDLDEYQIADRQRLGAQQSVQHPGLRRRLATKVVDPDAGIDQDQRSVLIASRSPCQGSLPR